MQPNKDRTALVSVSLVSSETLVALCRISLNASEIVIFFIVETRFIRNDMKFVLDFCALNEL